MTKIFHHLGATRAPREVVIIRLLVGLVFISEGVQKILFPEADGAGRFGRIGIPSPEIMAPFVACFEMVCGGLILFGWQTRLATLPLVITISVAITSTKIPILLGHGLWRFTLPKLGQYGFWSMAHEARADFSMLMCLLFLLVAGAGSWSVDAGRSVSRKFQSAP